MHVVCMSRTYHDRFLGRDILVPSRARLEAQRNAHALQAHGIDIVGLRCRCCGVKLIDLSKIKVSAEGAIGPECSRHYPEFYPCRRRQAKEVRAA